MRSNVRIDIYWLIDINNFFIKDKKVNIDNWFVFWSGFNNIFYIKKVSIEKVFVCSNNFFVF